MACASVLLFVDLVEVYSPLTHVKRPAPATPFLLSLIVATCSAISCSEIDRSEIDGSEIESR